MDTSFNLYPSISIWWLEILRILLVEKWPLFDICCHFNLLIFMSLSVSSCNKNNTHLIRTTAGNHLFCGTLQIHDHQMINQVNLSRAHSGTKTTHTMFYCLEKQLQYVTTQYVGVFSRNSSMIATLCKCIYTIVCISDTDGVESCMKFNSPK